MKAVDDHRYSMLVRVKEFGAAHRDRFPPTGLAGRLFDALTQAVHQLGAHVVGEETGRNVEQDRDSSKAAARDALRQALAAIARTADALDPGTRRIAAKFRLPSVRNDHELTTAARSFARDAARLKARFHAYGMPKTFLDDLQTALDNFERAALNRFAVREARATARAGIRAAIHSALIALHRLDAIVPNALREDPALLMIWITSRRVGRVRKAADRTTSGASATAAATPNSPAPSTMADAKTLA